MSSVYDPRLTSASAGGSLEGTMVQPQPDAGFGGEFERALAGLGQTQAGLVAQQEQPQPAFRKLTMKADGSVSIDTDQGTLAEVMAQLTDLKTMKTAAMARVAQLRQQEASGSPILDALSQLAGGLAANDPTMPGWVRALGATSLQMGPQGIAAKRAAEEAKVIGLSKEIAGTSLEAAKMEEDAFKLRVSLLESQKKQGAAEDKAATDAFFKVHDDAFQQITQSNAFDERGLRAKMQALQIPEDQIEAEVGALKQFQDDRKKKLDEAAQAKSAEERRKRREELDEIDAREARRDARQAKALAAAFGWRVMGQSKLPAAEEATLLDTTKALRSVANARRVLQENADKFGFGKGMLYTMKAWRGSEEQKMLSASVDTLTEAAKAAGLKPLSDTDLRIIKQGIFDPNKSVAANQAVLDDMQRKLEALIGDLMEMNYQVDWEAKREVVPPALHGKIPRLSKKRADIFGSIAPDGVGVPSYNRPQGTKKYPWE